jgi:hypothetical protein
MLSRRKVVRSLYWPFVMTTVLGITDLPDHLLPWHDVAHPILPSLPVALYVAGLGVLGCLAIVLSGALDPEKAPAEETPASGTNTISRIMEWIAETGCWAGLALGLVVAMWLRLPQSAAAVLGFYAGLAIIAVGLCGLWIVGRRQRPASRPEVPTATRAPTRRVRDPETAASDQIRRLGVDPAL